MDFFQAIVLGMFQGLGEFLPISSSAHLILAPYFFGWPEHDLSFDVALHFGTLLAVLAFFWSDWLMIILIQFGCPAFLKDFFQKHSTDFRYPKNFFWMIVLATIPGVLAGLFLDDYAEKVFRNPLLIATTLFSIGLVLFLVDKKSGNLRLSELGFQTAVIIGIFQALAIVPGISRSGITIIAALFLGLNRVSAARFSFLISTPLIIGAVLFKLNDFLSVGISTAEIVGIAVSAISGFLAIGWMLKYLRVASYKIFFFYRMILALAVILVWFLR